MSVVRRNGEVPLRIDTAVERCYRASAESSAKGVERAPARVAEHEIECAEAVDRQIVNVLTTR